MRAQTTRRAAAPRVRQLALPLPIPADLPELEPARRTLVVDLIAQMLIEATGLTTGGTSNDEHE